MDNIEIKNPEIELYRKIALSDKRPKVRKLMNMLGYTPHKGQEVILKYWDDNPFDFYFWALIIARRWGKTHLMGMLATADLLIPYASVIIISPQTKQSQLVYKEIVKNLKQLGIGFAKINNNEMQFVLENGSECIVGTEKNLTASEGRKASLLIIEEAGLVSSIDNILNSLMPSLATYGSRDNGLPVGNVILNGTYKGNKEHKKYYLKGQNERANGYISFSRPSADNPLNTPEFLQSQKELLEDGVFRREYMGELVDVNATDVFSGYNRQNNVIPFDNITPYIDKDTFIIGALDVGYVDATSYLLIKFEFGKYYIFDGFAESGLDEKQIAHKIKELENKWGITPKLRFCDPSSKMVIMSLGANYDLPFYPAKNKIREGVSTLNTLFRTNKLFVCDNMKQLISEIETIEWKDSSNNGNGADPFKRISGHHFDNVAAMRYGIYTHFLTYSDNDLIVI